MKIFKLKPNYDEIDVDLDPNYRFYNVIIAAISAESASVLFKQRLGSVLDEEIHAKAVDDGTIEEIDIQNAQEGAIFSEVYEEHCP